RAGSRRRLVGNLLTESLLLALWGAVASVALAYAGVQALAAINPANVDNFTFGRRISGLSLLVLTSIQVDARALLFTFAIALATGLLFGLMPALQGSRADVTDSLK